jgi:hypothetical protein
VHMMSTLGKDVLFRFCSCLGLWRHTIRAMIRSSNIYGCSSRTLGGELTVPFAFAQNAWLLWPGILSTVGCPRKGLWSILGGKLAKIPPRAK